MCAAERGSSLPGQILVLMLALHAVTEGGLCWPKRRNATVIGMFILRARNPILMTRCLGHHYLLWCSLLTCSSATEGARALCSSSESHTGKKFAVFIDAENVMREDVPPVLREVATMGDAIIKVAYADWTRPGMSKWSKVVQNHGVSAVQTFSHPKKSSSDMQMTVDGIDLLRTNRDVTSFAIVSSDADFTALARRLQEAGKDVVGFGRKSNLGSALIGSCTLFRYLENLRGLEEDSLHDNGMEALEDGQSAQYSTYAKVVGPQTDLNLTGLSLESDTFQFTSPFGTFNCEISEAELANHLEDAWMSTRNQTTGWSSVGQMNTYLQRRNINCVKVFGKKISKVIQESKLFQMKEKNSGLQVRLKNHASFPVLWHEQMVWKQGIADTWENIQDEEGFANLGAMKGIMLRRHPDFDPRTLGYPRISEMVRDMFRGRVDFGPSGTVRLKLPAARNSRGLSVNPTKIMGEVGAEDPSCRSGSAGSALGVTVHESEDDGMPSISNFSKWMFDIEGMPSPYTSSSSGIEDVSDSLSGTT